MRAGVGGVVRILAHSATGKVFRSSCRRRNATANAPVIACYRMAQWPCEMHCSMDSFGRRIVAGAQPFRHSPIRSDTRNIGLDTIASPIRVTLVLKPGLRRDRNPCSMALFAQPPGDQQIGEVGGVDITVAVEICGMTEVFAPAHEQHRQVGGVHIAIAV